MNWRRIAFNKRPLDNEPERSTGSRFVALISAETRTIHQLAKRIPENNTVKIYNNFLGISTPRNFFHKTCGEKVQNFWGYFHNANVVGLTISILGLGVGVKTPNS